MKDEDDFDNIISANFGDEHRLPGEVQHCKEEHKDRNWLGFAHAWVAAYDIPQRKLPPSKTNKQEDINDELRQYLSAVVDWLIKHEVADDLVDAWEAEEYIPVVAELLMLRIYDDYDDGLCCDCSVGGPSVAVIDMARLAVAFVTAFEAWQEHQR